MHRIDKNRYYLSLNFFLILFIHIALNMSFASEQNKASLILDVVQDKVIVYTNNVYYGMISGITRITNLMLSIYTIKVSKDGFEDFIGSVKIYSNISSELKIDLKKKSSNEVYPQKEQYKESIKTARIFLEGILSYPDNEYLRDLTGAFWGLRIKFGFNLLRINQKFILGANLEGGHKNSSISPQVEFVYSGYDIIINAMKTFEFGVDGSIYYILSPYITPYFSIGNCWYYWEFYNSLEESEWGAHINDLFFRGNDLLIGGGIIFNIKTFLIALQYERTLLNDLTNWNTISLGIGLSM